MDAAFEDVMIFMETLKEKKGNLSETVYAFVKKRKPSGDAIVKLSVRNYDELRLHIANPLFLLRKKCEGFLNLLFPELWIPLYKMIAFTHIPYEKCIERERNQVWFVKMICITVVMAIILGLIGQVWFVKMICITVAMAIIHGFNRTVIGQ